MLERASVVDDDNALREMVGIVLASEGFEVSNHDAGTGALEAFKTFEPDLVLLDSKQKFEELVVPFPVDKKILSYFHE